MAIFNSYVSHYQRVSEIGNLETHPREETLGVAMQGAGRGLGVDWLSGIVVYLWVNYNDLTVLPHWNHS